MTAGTHSGLPTLAEELAVELISDMAAVDQIVQDAVKSDVRLLHDACRHLMDAGGKRYRPMLTLLAARFGDHRDPDVLRAAAAVELVHLAALYHDDVMDKATLRRGVPSVNAKWNDAVAILAGDYLFSQAFLLLAAMHSQPARMEVQTFSLLVAGQFREMSGPEPGTDPVDHYVAMVSDKTASLMRSCLRLGALVARADQEAVHALEAFGQNLGVAFQVSDDLLDLVGKEEEFGKHLGGDLIKKSVTTLPLLYATRGNDPASVRLRELLETEELEAEARAEALSLLSAHPALDKTREVLRSYADRASTALDPLPDGPAKDGLRAMCTAVVERTR
ncbi:polyprenyl synthetase family protein [Wenjunlia vitaminophila]|uniref:polyprenyl synthetase family protein n=1 Tax=Wenjunlia vitaminophila TaxID=76728 RepID=UPI00191C607C|nr:polyprenyl synthetase family protein [Wenjunlia vitaminophila]